MGNLWAFRIKYTFITVCKMSTNLQTKQTSTLHFWDMMHELIVEDNSVLICITKFWLWHVQHRTYHNASPNILLKLKWAELTSSGNGCSSNVHNPRYRLANKLPSQGEINMLLLSCYANMNIVWANNYGPAKWEWYLSTCIQIKVELSINVLDKKMCNCHV